MIPISEAIETGTWLQAKNDNVTFRIRVTAFSKIDPANIPPIESKGIDIDSNIWLLSLDVINLCKTEQSLDTLKHSLKIMDEEEYEFSAFDSSSLYNNLGLSQFYSLSLPAKIKKSGALTFELPEVFEQLFLTINNGEISEV